MNLHRRGAGQSTVETALVLPIALVLILGIIGGGWLFYQSSAITDAARSGARTGTIETSLYTPVGGEYCESQMPVSIEQAVAAAAPQVQVNPARLCTTGAIPSTTTLQQPAVAGVVNIVVVAQPTLADPTYVTVTLTESLAGIASPLNGVYTITASSTLSTRGP